MKTAGGSFISSGIASISGHKGINEQEEEEEENDEDQNGTLIPIPEKKFRTTRNRMNACDCSSVCKLF